MASPSGDQDADEIEITFGRLSPDDVPEIVDSLKAISGVLEVNRR